MTKCHCSRMVALRFQKRDAGIDKCKLAQLVIKCENEVNINVHADKSDNDVIAEVKCACSCTCLPD